MVPDFHTAHIQQTIKIIAVDNNMKSTLIQKLFPDLKLSYVGVQLSNE